MAKTLSLQYISSFCVYLKLALESGLPVVEGVRLFSEEERDSALREMSQKIYESAAGGISLAAALRECGRFPQYMTEMIAVGERTGNLDRVLSALSHYYEGQEQLRRAIRNAVLYPVILLVMVICVLAVFLIAVLPIFEQVYEELGAQMSAFATGLMNVGIWLGRYWYVALAIIAALAAAVVVRRILARRKGRELPVFALFGGRRLAAAIARSRFADALYLGISSGLEAEQALEMASQIITDSDMRSKADACLAEVRSGSGFAESLMNAGIFPSLYGRMIAMGVRTGKADSVIAEIAGHTGAEAEDMLYSIVAKVEPTLVIIMSVLIGAVLLSVMLPLAGIMSSI